MADGREETLEIPVGVRAAVDERDQWRCRFCGKFLGQRRAQHHIEYGGMGARRWHDARNLLSLCYLPGDNGCHQRVHSNKGLYQPLLIALLEGGYPNHTTVLQLMRWRGIQP